MKLNKLFITSLLSSLLLLLASSRVASQSVLLSTYQSVMDVNDISSTELRTSPSHKLDSVITLFNRKAFYKFGKNSQSSYSLRFCDTSLTYSIPGDYASQEYNEQEQIVYIGISSLPFNADINELTFESLEDFPPTTIWNYTYDLENRLIKSERKTAIGVSCQFDSLTYDSAGNLKRVFTYFPVSGGFELAQRKLYTHIDDKLRSAVDVHLEDNEWIIKDSLHFSYNVTGLIDTMETFYWSPSINSYVPSEIETYEYDINNKLLTSFSYYGGGAVGEWRNIEKTSYVYDERGDLKENSSIYLRRSGTDYDEDDMPPLHFIVLLEHDHSVPFDEILFPKFPPSPVYWPIGSIGATKPNLDGSHHNSMVTNEVDVNEVTSSSRRSIFFYSEINPNSLLEPEIETLNIIPNPITDLLTIENTISNRELTLEIYGYNGVLVSTTPYHNSKSVDLSHLAPGLYYINLISENKVWTGSFVKI